MTVLIGGVVVVVGLFLGIRAASGDANPVPLVALDITQSSGVQDATVELDESTVSEPTLRPATIATPGSAGVPVADEAVRAAEDVLTFDGRPLRKVRTMRMAVTAYSPDERSCGRWADGRTASGYSVWTNGMKLVAADTRLLPFKSIISIPGYNHGKPVPVLDRGGVIKGHRLDVLYPTHEIARQWGVQELEVTVWEYAD